jgi:hypothetical protein
MKLHCSRIIIRLRSSLVDWVKEWPQRDSPARLAESALDKAGRTGSQSPVRKTLPHEMSDFENFRE